MVGAIAEEERHRVRRRARVVAGDEGIDRFELVDEAVGEQEIERAVDGRRRGGTCALAAGVVAGADQFKQVVGLDRLAGVGDQPEHARADRRQRSEEHTSELQSLMRISYAVFCLKKKTTN